MIQREKLCPICEQNLFRHFLCFDCHISFCRDCVKKNVEEQYVCGNCGESFLNSESEFSDAAIKLICKKCGSDSIEKIQKISGICPACGSSNISDIEGFRSYLKRWVQSILVNTKGLIAPLVDYFEYLKSLRTQVYNARKELPIAHHYTNLEKDLLHQLKIFTSLQKETEDLIEEYISEIIRNFDKVLKIDSAEIDELPVLDEYISRFQMSFEKSWSALQNLFVNGRDKLLPIVKKLDLIQAMKQRFMQFTGLINQEPNEYIVYCCECKINQTVSEKDVKNSIGKRGLLFVTTKTVEVLYEQGVLKKSWIKGIRIPIHTYKSFEIEGIIFKSKILQFDNDKIYLNIDENKFSDLITWLNAAKSWRMFNNQAFEELNNYDLNAEPIKQKLENYVFELLACFSSGEHPGTFIKSSNSRWDSDNQGENPSVFKLLNEEIDQSYSNQALNEIAANQNLAQNIHQQQAMWQNPSNNNNNQISTPQSKNPGISYESSAMNGPNQSISGSNFNQLNMSIPYHDENSSSSLLNANSQTNSFQANPFAQNLFHPMNSVQQPVFNPYFGPNIPMEQNALVTKFPNTGFYPNPINNGNNSPIIPNQAIPQQQGMRCSNSSMAANMLVSNCPIPPTNNGCEPIPILQQNIPSYPRINQNPNQNWTSHAQPNQGANWNQNAPYQQNAKPPAHQMNGNIGAHKFNQLDGMKQNKQTKSGRDLTSSNPSPPQRHKK